MTGAERGFLLLCCHLGDPQRRPLTVPQFRKLSRRVRGTEKAPGDRELEASDLTALGYSKSEAAHILELFEGEELLDLYLQKAAKYGCVPLTPLSAGYPRRLWEARGDDATACLWARGDLSILEKPGIALVGSRDLNPENAAFARQVGLEAARPPDLPLLPGQGRCSYSIRRSPSRGRFPTPPQGGRDRFFPSYRFFPCASFFLFYHISQRNARRV